MCELAIDEGYLKARDAKISKPALVNKYYLSIPKFCTKLRSRAHDAAKKRFQSQFIKDMAFVDGPCLLPMNLGEVQMSDDYR